MDLKQRAIKHLTRAICPYCEYRFPVSDATVRWLLDASKEHPQASCPRCRIVHKIRLEPNDERWANYFYDVADTQPKEPKKAERVAPHNGPVPL